MDIQKKFICLLLSVKFNLSMKINSVRCRILLSLMNDLLTPVPVSKWVKPHLILNTAVDMYLCQCHIQASHLILMSICTNKTMLDIAHSLSEQHE